MVEPWPEEPPKNLAELHEYASRPSEAVLRLAQSLVGDVVVLGAGGKMGLHLCRLWHRCLQEVGSPHRVIAVSRFGSPGATDEFDRQGIATQPCRVYRLIPLPE